LIKNGLTRPSDRPRIVEVGIDFSAKEFIHRNMDKLHYTPVHPGEVLQDELEEVGLTQSALAKHIGVLPKTINEICQKKRGISADMAMKLAKALGGSPRFWFNLQNNWEISLLKKTDFKEIKPLAA